jgi:hypothetical protein
MSRCCVRKFTPRDAVFLKRIARSGGVTISHGAEPSCGLESNDALPYGRFKRLVSLGYLQPNNDGLLKDCPQTYKISIPIMEQK